jgi:hypothetical protein
MGHYEKQAAAQILRRSRESQSWHTNLRLRDLHFPQGIPVITRRRQQNRTDESDHFGTGHRQNCVYMNAGKRSRFVIPLHKQDFVA